MAYIKLFDEKIEESKIWTKKLKDSCNKIEDNILQKDDGRKFEEKAVSALTSFGSLLTVGGIATIIGLGALVPAGAIGFVGGYFLSKKINKKVFGDEREKDSLNDDEKKILIIKDTFFKYIKSIGRKLIIKKYQKEVAFTNYREVRNKTSHLIDELKKMNTSSLSWKYEKRHNKLIQDFIKLSIQTDDIYKSNNSFGMLFNKIKSKLTKLSYNINNAQKNGLSQIIPKKISFWSKIREFLK